MSCSKKLLGTYLTLECHPAVPSTPSQTGTVPGSRAGKCCQTLSGTWAVFAACSLRLTMGGRLTTSTSTRNQENKVTMSIDHLLIYHWNCKLDFAISLMEYVSLHNVYLWNLESVCFLSQHSRVTLKQCSFVLWENLKNLVFTKVPPTMTLSAKLLTP